MNKQITQLTQVPYAKDNAYARSLTPALRQWSNDVTNQVNTQSQTFGAVLASATTVTLTNCFHHISGTAAIVNLIAPKGFTGPVYLIPDGLWTTTTGGNIALASTAVVNKVLIMVYDGALWYPSY